MRMRCDACECGCVRAEWEWARTTFTFTAEWEWARTTVLPLTRSTLRVSTSVNAEVCMLSVHAECE